MSGDISKWFQLQYVILAPVVLTDHVVAIAARAKQTNKQQQQQQQQKP